MADDDAKPERGPEIFSDPHHRRADAQLLRRAIANGWIKDRWPTRATKEEIERQTADRGAGRTLIELAVIETHSLLQSEDYRAKAVGARVTVAMERQNQVDELNALNAGNDPSQPQATTLTPEETVIAMDRTIPLAEETGT